MGEQEAAGTRLLALTRAHADSADQSALAEAIEEHWSPQCLVLLLDADDAEVAQAALLGLGLTGDMASCPAIARLLHHDEPDVVAASEDALWSVWFRAGGAMGRTILSRIVSSLRSFETENVVPLLTEVIRSMPDFAEAYHQRSQAYYLQDAFAPALRDARRAFELNPLHFGALANQAHCHTALGQLSEALRRYRQVLELHPRMPGIRECISRLRGRAALVDA